jgi:hypothetical protein
MIESDPKDKPTTSADPASEKASEPPDAIAADVAGSELFEQLWTRTLEDWGNQKMHDALLDLAKAQEKLADLGGRYRVIVEANDERSAYAKKRIDAIVITVTFMLTAAKTEPKQAPKWFKWVVMLVCGSVIAWVAQLFMK